MLISVPSSSVRLPTTCYEIQYVGFSFHFFYPKCILGRHNTRFLSCGRPWSCGIGSSSPISISYSIGTNLTTDIHASLLAFSRTLLLRNQEISNRCDFIGGRYLVFASLLIVLCRCFSISFFWMWRLGIVREVDFILPKKLAGKLDKWGLKMAYCPFLYSLPCNLWLINDWF